MSGQYYNPSCFGIALGVGRGRAANAGIVLCGIDSAPRIGVAVERCESPQVHNLPSGFWHYARGIVVNAARA